MILKLFTDVVPIRHHFLHKIDPFAPVPADILSLWKSRSYVSLPLLVLLVCNLMAMVKNTHIQHTINDATISGYPSPTNTLILGK